MDISRFGECFKKWLKSCAGVVVPPSKSCGTTLTVKDDSFDGILGSAAVSGIESSSSGGLRTAAEGPWNASKESKTPLICVANSLQLSVHSFFCNLPRIERIPGRSYYYGTYMMFLDRLIKA